jgi:catechol 2,3-dioxygenase-like lactoylglutathione lyase family enzyme
MEQRLTFLTLGVKDMKTAIDFYENKFEWRRSDKSTENLILYELPHFLFALYPLDALAEDAQVAPGGDGFKGFAMAYNVWSEQEVDEVVESLRAKGVKVVKEPQQVFWGGYSSYIADPDGHLWEIAYNPFLEKDF